MKYDRKFLTLSLPTRTEVAALLVAVVRAKTEARAKIVKEVFMFRIYIERRRVMG